LLGHQGKGKPLVLPRLDPQCRRICGGGGAVRGMHRGKYPYGGGGREGMRAYGQETGMGNNI